jgi:nucleoside-diphosphate-sugar epimerase
MASDGPNVLVTGPTGVVGAPLLDRLPSESVVALSHSAEVASEGVRVVHGDVTRPRLGLSEADYADLAGRIDLVIHSAAATRFDLTREETFAVNVEGAKRVLQLAADAGARLVALSTAFVEVETGDEFGWLSPRHYLDSKRAAEALVRESGLDWHLVRPSVVVGHSKTGKSERLQGYHFFIQALLRDQLPMIPVDVNDVLDFVPADLLADVIAEMVQGAPPWEVSWVTAGPRAWTNEHAVGQVIAAAARHGHTVTPPRLVPLEMVERLVRPVFFPELPKRVVRRYDQVVAMSKVVVPQHPFPSSLDDLERHYGRELSLDLERTFESSIGFLLDSLPKPVTA